MKKYPIEIGSIVISTAGRDEGRRFIVAQEIDGDFVMVTDGALRGMDRLKKKRRKHLKPTGDIIEAFRAKVQENVPVENHEVRSWLKMEES